MVGQGCETLSRVSVSRLCGASFHDAPRNSASPNSAMRPWRRIGDLNPLGTRNFKGGKMGLSLYRLPCSCHAESLIPAEHFFVKKRAPPCVRGSSRDAEIMSAAEHARDFLRRTVCAAYGDECLFSYFIRSFVRDRAALWFPGTAGKRPAADLLQRRRRSERKSLWR